MESNIITLPPMRTIDEAHKEILAQDPNSSLTKTALRRMVVSGELPSKKAGNKYLINMETLYEHFQSL